MRNLQLLPICVLSLLALAVGRVWSHEEAGRFPHSVVTADFNSDGHQDLTLVLAGTHSIVAYLGDGAGGFTPAKGPNQ